MVIYLRNLFTGITLAVVLLFDSPTAYASKSGSLVCTEAREMIYKVLANRMLRPNAVDFDCSYNKLTNSGNWYVVRVYTQVPQDMYDRVYDIPTGVLAYLARADKEIPTKTAGIAYQLEKFPLLYIKKDYLKYCKDFSYSCLQRFSRRTPKAAEALKVQE